MELFDKAFELGYRTGVRDERDRVLKLMSELTMKKPATISDDGLSVERNEVEIKDREAKRSFAQPGRCSTSID
jgi:hypothetical protein